MTPVREKALAARKAALSLQRTPGDARSRALHRVAESLRALESEVLAANREDVTAAKAAGVAKPLLDRLKLTPEKFRLTLDGVLQVAALPDPVGRTLRATELDDGLKLYQVTTPLGVLACVFESRPDVVVQISALAVKSANAVLLKGGAEATRTNAALAGGIRSGLAAAGLPADAVQLLEGRGEVAEVLALDDLVDLVIPRGSTSLVRHIQSNTRIPVLGHAEGVCHVYVDRAADPGKALRICLDAKLDYPAACNAAECFLVHRDVARDFVPRLVAALQARGVEVRADAVARALAPEAKAAGDEDWGREFGDLVCALRVVEGLEEAIDFVNRHGSKHTDAIVTEDGAAAKAFVAGVDSAGVYVNASTRFADGYRYGLGAEVGISTSKVHARGPVGLEGLVLYKWVLVGEGNEAGPYARGEQAFAHRPIREGWE